MVPALVLGAWSQAGGPGELYVDTEGQRAVLVEDGDFYAEASSDAELVTRLPAGTVLSYAGEVVDDFGRTWFAVRDPNRVERRRDVYLAPFDRGQFQAFGYRGALLADREGFDSRLGDIDPDDESDMEEASWWTPVAELRLGHHATFDSVVAVGARLQPAADVVAAIDLLGGRDGIADWPADPLPGELFIPEAVPALFSFDGDDWRLSDPARLFTGALSILGNSEFRTDPSAPPLVGGPSLHCWELVDAVDPRGTAVGGVEEAPAAEAPRGPGGASGSFGPFDARLAPSVVAELLPPAPLDLLVPERVDPRPTRGGILLKDEDSLQAVYLIQRVGSLLTHRLRGEALVLDVVARNDPGADAAATFGAEVEVSFADGREPELILDSFTTTERPFRFELPLTVPVDADSLTIRLLPLDRTLARDQRGSVVFDRASLRLEAWAPEPAPGSVYLHRITATAYEGTLLHTRAPIAVSSRHAREIERVWPAVAAADWSDADKRLVLAGELRHGMSTEQVRLAWGNPLREGDSTPAGGDDRRWEYDHGYAVFSADSLILFRRERVLAPSATRSLCPGAADALPSEGSF